MAMKKFRSVDQLLFDLLLDLGEQNILSEEANFDVFIL